MDHILTIERLILSEIRARGYNLITMVSRRGELLRVLATRIQCGQIGYQYAIDAMLWIPLKEAVCQHREC